MYRLAATLKPTMNMVIGPCSKAPLQKNDLAVVHYSVIKAF
jgi:hypothetical protein